jgi:methionine sulfoxide reductase heme-binding subunit
MAQRSPRAITAVRMALFLACLVPFALLVWGAASETLGTNPIETITRETGWWALFLLCATLTVSPLRHLTGAGWLLKLRRMLGLFAFFYACVHFVAFVWFDHWFDPASIVNDVIERPFVTLGFAAFVLLIPLAFTSTYSMQRTLGHNWQRLHRLAYAAAVLGVLHFWWLVKLDVTEPAGFALLLVALFVMRIAFRAKNPSSSRPLAPRA